MALTKASAIRVATALLVLMITVTTPVAAQQGGDGDPEAGEGIFNAFDRAEVFVLDVLWYGGSLVIATGMALWFSAKKSADRAEWGKYAMGSGVAAMGFAKLFPAVMGVINWIFG